MRRLVEQPEPSRAPSSSGVVRRRSKMGEMRMFFRKRKRKSSESLKNEEMLFINRAAFDSQQEAKMWPTAPSGSKQTKLNCLIRISIFILLAALLTNPVLSLLINNAAKVSETKGSEGSSVENDSKMIPMGAVADWLVEEKHKREKRANQNGKQLDLTRIVGVAGQWIELQCPLANELLAVANSGAPNSHPDHSIVWRKNGQRLSQLSPRQKVNAQNGSLVIVSAQPNLDEASYECCLIQTVKEDEPLKRHRFELKLLVPPRLAPFESPAGAQVGMKVVLTCSALEGQQPISFVWLKDNQIILESSSSQSANTLNQLHQQQLADKLSLSSATINLKRLNEQASSEYVVLGQLDQDESGASEQLLPLLSDSNVRIRQSDDYSILSIDRLDLKHSGKYTCSAQNEAARASHSSQLVINAPPTLTVEPKDGDLVSGQSSVIECAASGQPRPTISWLRARESANKVWDYLPVYDNLRYTTLPNGSLAIANVTQREQGYYLCSAKNGFGPEMTKLIRITVHEPAKFSSKYKTVEVRTEERANMVCAATGELPITIEWFDKEGNSIQKNDKKFIIDNDPYEIGQSEPIQQANSTISRLILARSSRLDSGHYTCQAINKYGTDKMVTNLLIQDVPDKVTELKVTNTTSTTVSLRWQLAFNGNSPITSYLVQYQSDDPLDDLLISAQPANINSKQLLGQESSANPELAGVSNSKTVVGLSPTSSLKAALDSLNIASSAFENADEAIDRTLVELTVEQSSTHLVVKDLTPYCVYRLRLAGINKIGLGEFSDWIRAQTEEAPPGGSALKILASATGPNSIKLTWSPPDRRSWNGQLIGFNIGYRPIDSSFELNKTIEWSSPTLQSIMQDASKSSAIIAAKKTTNILATNSSDLQQTSEPKKQATINNSTINSDPSNSKYLLRQHLRQLLALQQQELVAHLTNLQRSTTYLVWIQALNKRGFGPQSHAISIKTLDDVPPSAPALKVQSATTNSITISWSLLSNFVSSANQYSLFYRRIPSASPGNRTATGTGGPLAEPNQLGQASDPSAIYEPGPFIERTISNQVLMLSSNNNINMNPMTMSMTSEENLENSMKATFMHQSQHYQHFVYTLDQLDCGSIYELYMTTRNSVGKSEPSAILTTRTMGEPPQAPLNKNSLFAKIGNNDVTLNLAAWSTGGCPLTHISVRYKQAPVPTASATVSSPDSKHNSSSSSLLVSWPVTTSISSSLLSNLNAHIQPQRSFGQMANLKQASEPVYVVKNLIPSTCYDLELIAYNAAGHTSAQYEFVTSSANGTRGGYTRKESIYRLDQRGVMLEQSVDGSASYIEQQLSANQNSSLAWQLIPAALMILCLICLLVSSTFCYYRVASSLKKHHHRRSSTDTMGAISSTTSRTHCHQQPNTSSSPSSIGKSSMWRLNHQNQFNSVNHSNSLKHQQIPEQDDSPTTMHYCMRDPQQANANQLMSATLNPTNTKTFTQSVSMKDFNLISAPQAATLNFKYSRASGAGTIRTGADTIQKGATMRARLSTGESRCNEQHLPNDSYNHTSCTTYAQNCMKQKEDLDVYSNRVDQQYHQHCNNYSNDGVEHQETSWTNYATTNQQQFNQMRNKHTTYAIPTSATIFAEENQLNGVLSQQQIDEYQRNNYGAIDACIQQLVNQQQYQDQQQLQQQQQYAMIVGKNNQEQANRCLYENQPAPQATFKVQNGGQSIIDSSSSSSGVDVGNHVECASTMTATSNNSNGSNNNYQMNQAQYNSCNQHGDLNNNNAVNQDLFQYPPPAPQTVIANELDLKQL